MTRFYVILFILFLPLFSSCGGSNEETNRLPGQNNSAAEQDMSQLYQTEPQQELLESTSSFRNSLSGALDLYFELKDSLYNSNVTSSSEIVTNLINQIGSIDADMLNEKADSVWSIHSETILSVGNQLYNAAEIDQQRGHFKQISRAMINLVGSFKPASYEVFVFTCRGSGSESGIWLNRSVINRNPYQGTAPDSCGEVERKI